MLRISKKTKMPCRLLPMIEQMYEGVPTGKYDIAVFANLKDAFDAVWRKWAIYKLHKAGITNNLCSVFSSFLTDRLYRNLVNSYTSDWACTTTGVPQGSLLSPFIFLVFTTDMALEKPEQTPEIPTESKYADNFKFWRTGTDFYNLLIQITNSYNQPPDLVPKIMASMNHHLKNKLYYLLW